LNESKFFGIKERNKMLMTDMNQTYLIMTTEMKRAEMKLKLNEIRERSKLLLKKHNWKKYFHDDDYPNQSCSSSSSSGCSSMVITNHKEGCVLTTKETRFSKLFSAIDFDLSSNNEYDEESCSVISTVKSSPTINHNNNTITMPVYDLSKIVFDASTLIASQSSM